MQPRKVVALRQAPARQGQEIRSRGLFALDATVEIEKVKRECKENEELKRKNVITHGL